MKKYTPFLRILLTVLVLWLAWLVRDSAARALNVDWDENDYLRAAQEYALVFRDGDLSGLSQFNYRPEHPPLAKMLFGLAIVSDPEAPLVPDVGTDVPPRNDLPQPHLLHARQVSAFFGALTAGLLALLNPLAGFFLAGHTFNIKYTSQVMLEAVPAFTSLVTALAYVRFKHAGKFRWAWLALSGLFLGLTAASKYLYAIVGVAILADWAWMNWKSGKRSLKLLHPAMFAWGIFSLLVFFAADPYLWPAPLERLRETIFYHGGYATGEQVQDAGNPIWQPFVWLTVSPYAWNPEFFTLAPDLFIFLLACVGARRLWQKEPFYLLWFGIQLAFLLIWPTKWAQYVITLTAVVSLAAGDGVITLYESLRGWWAGRAQTQTAAYRPRETKAAIPWLVPGLVAFAVFTLLPLLFQLAISLTDFSTASIRDGFQGGIWREVWGGLTGQIQPSTSSNLNDNKVNYVGLNAYTPVFGFVGIAFGQPFTNLLWTVLAVTLQTALGLGVALLLRQRGIQFRRGWELLFILPWAIPEMLGALMWFNVFAPEAGWLALAAREYGKNIPFAPLVNWFNSWETAFQVFLIAATWYGFPFMFLAASTGLKMIPPDVYDAASIDGANDLQVFRYVTWPLLLPLLLPAILVRGIFSFNQFYLFQAFFAAPVTMSTLSYNIFNPASDPRYGGGQFATSAVINVMILLFLALFVYIFNRWSKAGEGVTYA